MVDSILWPKPFDHLFRSEDVPMPRNCICGGAGYYRMNAPPGHPLFGKGIPCICRANANENRRATELRGWSGISRSQLFDLTFERFDPTLSVPPPHLDVKKVRAEMGRIKQVCQQYAAKPQGWLVLVGAVGSGKTHLACAIVNAVLAQGKGAHFNSVAGMLDLLRSTYKIGAFDTWFQRLQTVTVLALDDLGAERATDWATEKLFELVDHRYVNRLPLVVTTNLALTDEGIALRLRSRLQEGSEVRQGWSRVLPLPAGDIRPRREWARDNNT